ncbi:MAG TPA: biopolymer transporter ExbD [Opitutaceae bacterium]|nr:biopolymer transporter ExbD [Opitutaceae bacterium]
MITRPLNLESHLRPKPKSMDWAYWVNVGLIAFFFTFFGSRFVLSPGLSMSLPNVAASAITPVATNVVLSMRRSDMIVFEDGVYNLSTIRTRLESYAKNKKELSLLIRSDRQVPFQDVSAVAVAAREAGFQVTLAAEAGSPDTGLAAPAGR